MIERYSRPEMAWIWEDRHRYQVWLEVELTVCGELAERGLIPKADWTELRKRAKNLMKEGGVDPKDVDRHEALTRHDVIAFTTAVAEKIGPLSRYIHFGLTSSDVVDTSLSLLIQEAGKILKNDVLQLRQVLLALAQKYRALPTMGRSHGIFAEPTSFGLKFLGWYEEWTRNEARLKQALEDTCFGKLSGAVGVNPHWSPDFEEKVLNQLGLNREPVSTQIIPRDRHAALLQTLGVLGSSLERIAVELRHLQRSEVGEVMEGFRKGQKGSSAMPHKRNPISSENITGCARLLRSYAQAGLENVALWHERDISHSSVERVIFPDATLILDYSLNRMIQVLENLVVNESRVGQNLNSAGTTIFSGHFLLELVKAGATREQAYGWVQECALAVLEGQGDLIDRLVNHSEVRAKLSEGKIREIGSISFQLRHVDSIYEKVLAARGLDSELDEGEGNAKEQAEEQAEEKAKEKGRVEKKSEGTS